MRFEPKAERIPTTKAGDPMGRFYRWPGINYERGEGLLLTLPSLSGRSIYLSIHVRRGRMSHVGWGRQFVNAQPWWAHYIWWGRL